MARSVNVTLDLPKDWKRFRMPDALRARLEDLLDLQQESGKLSVRERKEADALVELAEMLTLLKLRSRRART